MVVNTEEIIFIILLPPLLSKSVHSLQSAILMVFWTVVLILKTHMRTALGLFQCFVPFHRRDAVPRDY